MKKTMKCSVWLLVALNKQLLSQNYFQKNLINCSQFLCATESLPKFLVTLHNTIQKLDLWKRLADLKHVLRLFIGTAASQRTALPDRRPLQSRVTVDSFQFAAWLLGRQMLLACMRTNQRRRRILSWLCSKVVSFPGKRKLFILVST
jgi:hypothetical protein